MINAIKAFIYTVLTLGVYLGCVVLSVILFLGAICFIIGDWGMWHSAWANPYITRIAVFTVVCLIGYFIYLLLSTIPPHKEKPKSKQSKNTYIPK